MYNKNTTKVVPWINSHEFEDVYTGLFSNSITEQKEALERINVWKSRGILPVAIESTYALFKVVINHVEVIESGRNVDDTARTAFSLAIIRFVNHITEKAQVRQRIQPVHILARGLGVPDWIVQIRHDATHGKLPSIDLLKTAADWCILWLKDEYWEKQLEGISGQEFVESDFKLKDEVGDLLTRYEDLKISPKRKKENKIMTKISQRLETEVLYNRENAVISFARKITETVQYKAETDDVLSFWDPVIQIYQQCGLSLLLLKYLPVTETSHNVISSFLYRLFSTGSAETVVDYFDFLLNLPDQTSVINLLQKLDLHCLLPSYKAEQLTKLVHMYLTDEISNTEKIFQIEDLTHFKENENCSGDSVWNSCLDSVNWSQIPLGSIPGFPVTYKNLRLDHTLPEDKVLNGEYHSEDEMEFCEESTLSDNGDSIQHKWSEVDMDKIQNLIQIL